MGNKILRFIFFGNYFVGLLPIALSLEAARQLRLPFNSINYYLLLFLTTVIYYTYAYNNQSATLLLNNPRSRWYFKHKTFINRSQAILLTLAIVLALRLLYYNYNNFSNLPVSYWVVIAVIAIAGALYYGLIPKFLKVFNLRNIGWLKSFTIGFVWACCANVLPLIMLRIETGVNHYDPFFWAFLFIKNWMFCTVIAIIFDIKDYPTDANEHLKTFVVRFGLRKTIFYILIPLLVIGMISLFFFVRYKGFGPAPFIFNVFPLALTVYVAYSMRKRKNILYYLMVIDGLILLKAICGMIAMFFIPEALK